jgi:N-acetylmuramoyl-L-alanine amidase
MVVVLRRNNILLVMLILLLSIAVYSLNFSGGDKASAAVGQSENKVVLLDPGHGGEDPGAVSDYSGIKESSINLYIAKKVKEILEAENYQVLMTRDEDRLEYTPETKSVTEKRRQDLVRRKKMMDEAGANIVVSIHLNKFEPQWSGAQTFYAKDSVEGRKLAVAIQASLREIDPSNKREALVKGKPSDIPIIILRDVKTTTAVVECGFLSNVNEEKLLGTTEYQDKLADAISKGIVNYFQKN